MKFIWYYYPKGGLVFRIGNDVTIYNISFACGIMTKKRFWGYLSFTAPRGFNILEESEVNDPEANVGVSRRLKED